MNENLLISWAETLSTTMEKGDYEVVIPRIAGEMHGYALALKDCGGALTNMAPAVPPDFVGQVRPLSTQADDDVANDR